MSKNNKIKEITDPLESIYNAIVFDSIDYTTTRRLAWIYGIVVGWRGNALKDVSEKYNWDAATCLRLKKLHKKYKSLITSFNGEKGD